MDAAGRILTLAEVEAEHIRQALLRYGGNITAAARALGIYRSSLQRKMRKHRIARGVAAAGDA